MHLLRRVVLLGCLAAAANAQTYIVDQANGPGTNFTDIAAAVAAVPDGAKLEVRAGAYAPFTISGKGLSVFCASGVTLTGNQGFTVYLTSASQTVVVRGVQMNGYLLVQDCQGPVVIEHCSVLSVVLPLSLMLYVTDCAQVHVADSAVSSGYVTNSTVVLRGTSVRGFNCLYVQSSTVDLIDCVQFTQANGVFFSWPAVVLQGGGSVRVVGGSVTTLNGECFSGMGTVRVDPTVTLAPGNSWPVSTAPMTIAPMPSVVASDGPLGGVVTTTMRGPNGEFGALLVGLHGAPWSYPGIADPIWLQPGSEAVCAFTVFAAGTPLQVSYALPNVPALRGMRFGWQGISYGAVNGMQASNPAITTHW